MQLTASRYRALCTVIFPAFIGLAATIPSNAEDITLQDALYESIEHNLSLRIQAYQSYLREQDVVAEQSVFDTSLFGSVSLDRQEQGWSQSKSESEDASVGVRKKFSTGTSVSVQSNYIESEGSRFDTTLNQEIGGNLSHNMGISLSVRQPLLQGFGQNANKASLWKAEASLAVAQLEYKNSLLDNINATEIAYWRLAYQKAVLKLSESSVELAENLLEETHERAEVGLATRLDVLQAQANLATQKEAFIDSNRAVDDAKDGLLLQMGRLKPGEQIPDINVGDLAVLEEDIPTLNEFWSGALTNDLMLLIQQTNIESLGFDKMIAKDRQKSQLDVVVSGSSRGFSQDSRDDAFAGAFEKDGHDWGIGLELSVPIGKRRSKAYLNQIEASIEREALRLEALEQDLFQRVRQAWRAYSVSLEKLQATRVTLELQTEAFEQEQAKYSEGLAVFRNVQEAQELLDRARISELNAWFASLRALANLSRLDGSVLERHNIDLNFE